MKISVAAAALVFGALSGSQALACSICRCGDATFNALGKEGVAQEGFRMALDWDQLEKSQGVPDEEFESMRERRMTLLLAYGLSEKISIFARLPYSERELTEHEEGESERTRVRGVADPEVYGQLRLWSSGFDGAVGIRAALFAVFGVKTAWGEDNVSREGERLDEHVQPGTGSTDWFAGLSGSYQLNPRSALFASAQYRLTGRNDQGYRYGRVSLVNLAYEHKLTARWDAALEANYRHAGLDQVDATRALDPDTGGSMLYVTPRILLDAGHGWVVRLSSQIPLSQSGLHGDQKEKIVYNVGVTHLFRK